MDQANTNTQAGQDLQSLQPQNNGSQQTSGNFQAGSGVNLSDGNTTNLLNQGVGGGNLSVAVASSNSQTSIAPPQPLAASSSGVPAYYGFVALALFLLAVYTIYRKAKRFDEEASKTNPSEEEVLGDMTWVTKVKNKKKKRKKPKKAHHH